MDRLKYIWGDVETGLTEKNRLSAAEIAEDQSFISITCTSKGEKLMKARSRRKSHTPKKSLERLSMKETHESDKAATNINGNFHPANVNQTTGVVVDDIEMDSNKDLSVNKDVYDRIFHNIHNSSENLISTDKNLVESNRNYRYKSSNSAGSIEKNTDLTNCTESQDVFAKKTVDAKDNSRECNIIDAYGLDTEGDEIILLSEHSSDDETEPSNILINEHGNESHSQSKGNVEEHQISVNMNDSCITMRRCVNNLGNTSPTGSKSFTNNRVFKKLENDLNTPDKFSLLQTTVKEIQDRLEKRNKSLMKARKKLDVVIKNLHHKAQNASAFEINNDSEQNKNLCTPKRNSSAEMKEEIDKNLCTPKRNSSIMNEESDCLSSSKKRDVEMLTNLKAILIGKKIHSSPFDTGKPIVLRTNYKGNYAYYNIVLQQHEFDFYIAGIIEANPVHSDGQEKFIFLLEYCENGDLHVVVSSYSTKELHEQVIGAIVNVQDTYLYGVLSKEEGEGRKLLIQLKHLSQTVLPNFTTPDLNHMKSQNDLHFKCLRKYIPFRGIQAVIEEGIVHFICHWKKILEMNYKNKIKPKSWLLAKVLQAYRYNLGTIRQLLPPVMWHNVASIGDFALVNIFHLLAQKEEIFDCCALNIIKENQDKPENVVIIDFKDGSKSILLENGSVSKENEKEEEPIDVDLLEINDGSKTQSISLENASVSKENENQSSKTRKRRSMDSIVESGKVMKKDDSNAQKNSSTGNSHIKSEKVNQDLNTSSRNSDKEELQYLLSTVLQKSDAENIMKRLDGIKHEVDRKRWIVNSKNSAALADKSFHVESNMKENLQQQKQNSKLHGNFKLKVTDCSSNAEHAATDLMRTTKPIPGALARVTNPSAQTLNSSTTTYRSNTGVPYKYPPAPAPYSLHPDFESSNLSYCQQTGTYKTLRPEALPVSAYSSRMLPHPQNAYLQPSTMLQPGHPSNMNNNMSSFYSSTTVMSGNFAQVPQVPQFYGGAISGGYGPATSYVHNVEFFNNMNHGRHNWGHLQNIQTIDKVNSQGARLAKSWPPQGFSLPSHVIDIDGIDQNNNLEKHVEPKVQDNMAGMIQTVSEKTLMAARIKAEKNVQDMEDELYNARQELLQTRKRRRLLQRKVANLENATESNGTYY